MVPGSPPNWDIPTPALPFAAKGRVLTNGWRITLGVRPASVADLRSARWAQTLGVRPASGGRPGSPLAVSRMAGRCLGRPSSGAFSAVEREGPPEFRMALLGTMRDEKVAKRLNRPIKSVQPRHLQFRRRPFGARPFQPWPKVSKGAVRNMCRFIGSP